MYVTSNKVPIVLYDVLMASPIDNPNKIPQVCFSAMERVGLEKWIARPKESKEKNIHVLSGSVTRDKIIKVFSMRNAVAEMLAGSQLYPSFRTMMYERGTIAMPIIAEYNRSSNNCSESMMMLSEMLDKSDVGGAVITDPFSGLPLMPSFILQQLITLKWHYYCVQFIIETVQVVIETRQRGYFI